MLRVDNDPIILGPGSPLSAAPLTGQPAPTTSTVGQLGDVRFDTDGNRWELTGIVGGLYYWALPESNFPSSNVEYIAFMAGSTPVFKQKISNTCPPTNASKFISVAYLNIKDVVNLWAMTFRAGFTNRDYYFSTTNYIQIAYKLDTKELAIYTPTNAIIQNAPIDFYIMYTKNT